MGYTHTQNSGLFWISESDLIYNGVFPNKVTFLSTETWDFNIQFSGHRSQLLTDNLATAHSVSSEDRRKDQGRKLSQDDVWGTSKLTLPEIINRAHVPHPQ